MKKGNVPVFSEQSYRRKERGLPLYQPVKWNRVFLHTQGDTEHCSGMSGNRIEANYVHHFARRLYDAGGLYTLSNQPSSVMRNNRIEHLIDAPYATNDRAFYIYFDEATDGYTVENNWCPSERFDSNRPGPHNVWKKNGPQVDESIKQKAGRVAVGGVSQPRIIIKTK